MNDISSQNTVSTLSPKEVAQQLGLCTKTVLKRVREGSIQPVYRINKRVIRIPQEAIDRYLTACQSSCSDPPRNGHSRVS